MTSTTNNAAAASRLREQRFNVEHYFGFWKFEPTPTNWLRVIGAVEGYAPEGPVRPGQYVVWSRCSGRQLSLARVERVSAQGTVYGRVYAKGRAAWGPERKLAHPGR